jgi:CubicO group peptidase (beta-lactamase class C family)
MPAGSQDPAGSWGTRPQDTGPQEGPGAFLERAVAAGDIPGAVFTAGHPGQPPTTVVTGQAQATGGPPRPMRASTLFDLASLTKVVATTPVVLILAERGDLHLDDQVVRYLPGFGGDNHDRRDEITLRHLLAHTSGLPAEKEFWRLCPDPAAACQAMLQVPLEHPPGARTLYSDVGFMLLGRVVAAVTSAPLNEVVAELVTGPLGLTRTGFHPGGPAASTEPQPDGSVLTGVVHDENARFLGGVAGHAGLFAPVSDLARYLEQAWLGDALLSPATRAEACTLQGEGTGGRRGLGWVLRGDAHDSLGSHWPGTSASHTGFTGTSLAFDPVSGYWAVLLTNDVHFGRNRGVIRRLREAVHDRCAPPGR